MKLLKRIIEIFVGSLFIFSGLVKINDPMGTAIKLEEYFVVFSTDIHPFFHVFEPLALTLSVVFCTAEVVLGVALLANFRKKTVIGSLLALIVFFTFLTFYSAYFNKVTDCGCFGDAIKLTPWQSFSKDVILLVLLIFLVSKWKSLANTADKIASLATYGSLAFCLGIAWYALYFLPPIDFLQYKVGANIPQLMQPAEPCQYEYVMTKDGQTFVFRDYPTDQSYQFVEMRTLNPEVCQPKILDYAVLTPEGEDMTDASLSGKKMLIIVQSIKKTDLDAYPALTQLVNGLEGTGIEPMILTSDANEFDIFRHEVQLAAPYFKLDGTVAKAMIRSNPGVLLLEEGTVLGKWPSSQIPTLEEIKQLLAK